MRLSTMTNRPQLGSSMGGTRHGKLALRGRPGDCDEPPLMLGNAVFRGHNLRMLAIIAMFGRGQGVEARLAAEIDYLEA